MRGVEAVLAMEHAEFGGANTKHGCAFRQSSFKHQVC